MRPYTHITTEERACLAEYLKNGMRMVEIATLLERDVSTISREIKRNRNKHEKPDGTYYSATAAASRYRQRRKRCVRKPRLIPGTELYNYVCSNLKDAWSPEEIELTWKQLHPGEKLSEGTIYRAVFRGELPEIAPETHLRRRGKRKYGKRGKFYTIKPEHTIHDRPEAAQNRERIGDWEGDTVAGGVRKGYLVTLVDRLARYLVVAKVNTLNAGVVAESVIKALKSSKLPVKTITFDNGSEFAEYKAIERGLNTTVYFADPHSPWQRGTNECFNDRLRFFFPKGSDLRPVSDETVADVVSSINRRPRKCLGLRSPASFANLCT